MCYLYQLQGACGYSVTRHPESNEPALGWRATTENIIFRLKKNYFSFTLRSSWKYSEEQRQIYKHTQDGGHIMSLIEHLTIQSCRVSKWLSSGISHSDTLDFNYVLHCKQKLVVL